MGYNKTTWQNNVTPANETNLNNIENGVELANEVLVDTGTADNLAIDIGDNTVANLKISVKVAENNTGATTIDVTENGTTNTYEIKKNITEDLEADDISAGEIITLAHDATNFQAINLGGAKTLPIRGSSSYTNASLPTTPVNVTIPLGAEYRYGNVYMHEPNNNGGILEIHLINGEPNSYSFATTADYAKFRDTSGLIVQPTPAFGQNALNHQYGRAFLDNVRLDGSDLKFELYSESGFVGSIDFNINWEMYL